MNDHSDAQYTVEKCNKACKGDEPFVNQMLSTGNANAYRDSFEAECNGKYDDCTNSVLADIDHHVHLIGAVLTNAVSVPELLAPPSVQRQMDFAVHDPAILLAEDLKVHGRREAAELLSGALCPERCYAARAIGRHVSRACQNVNQEVRDLHGRRFCMWKHISLALGVLQLCIERESFLEFEKRILARRGALLYGGGHFCAVSRSSVS